MNNRDKRASTVECVGCGRPATYSHYEADTGATIATCGPRRCDVPARAATDNGDFRLEASRAGLAVYLPGTDTLAGYMRRNAGRWEAGTYEPLFGGKGWFPLPDTYDSITAGALALVEAAQA